MDKRRGPRKRSARTPTDAWRLARGLTIGGLAGLLGVPYVTAEAWCAGRFRPLARTAAGWEAEFPGLFGEPADAKSAETKGRQGKKKIVGGA